jgi:hypothetical protein
MLSLIIEKILFIKKKEKKKKGTEIEIDNKKKKKKIVTELNNITQYH